MFAYLTPVSTLVCVVMILIPLDMRVSVKMDSMGELVKMVSIKIDFRQAQIIFTKDIEILAMILVPLIMTLSRGHTGQIKRTVIMR